MKWHERLSVAIIVVMVILLPVAVVTRNDAMLLWLAIGFAIGFGLSLIRLHND